MNKRLLMLFVVSDFFPFKLAFFFFEKKMRKSSDDRKSFSYTLLEDSFIFSPHCLESSEAEKSEV